MPLSIEGSLGSKNQLHIVSCSKQALVIPVIIQLFLSNKIFDKVNDDRLR